MGHKFSDISIGLLIVAFVFMIYLIYACEDSEKKTITKSSAVGALRGFITGCILGGVETGIVIGITNAVVSPLIVHFEHM